jgi:hypothetical protein
MPESPDALSTPSPLLGDDPAIAVLVIDAGGQVVAGNPAARSFACDGKPLVGRFLINLFVGEEFAADADYAAQQWRALRSEAMDKWVSRRLVCGGDIRGEVRLRLERSLGGAGSYIATVIAQDAAMTATEPH